MSAGPPFRAVLLLIVPLCAEDHPEYDTDAHEGGEEDEGVCTHPQGESDYGTQEHSGGECTRRERVSFFLVGHMYLDTTLSPRRSRE